MKTTRFLSLLLAVLMIASTVLFSGCAEAEGEEDEGGSTANTSTREIVALNMYILTEDTTTEEAADRVQMALNQILLPNYKTMLKLNYLTEENYWAAVESALAETDPSVNTSLESATVVGTEKLDFPETVEFIFDDGTKDIELSQPQIDIFVVNDYDKYSELANDGKLASLNQFISYDSKILKTNIHPTIMSTAQIGAQIYGIPTNVGVDAGEYTYLVFNEDLVNKYGYKITDLANFSGIYFANFMADVKANEPGIWPLSEPFGLAGEEFYDDAFVAAPTSIQYIAADLVPTFMSNRFNTTRIAAENYASLGYYPMGYAPAGAKYAVKVETSKELLTDDEQKRWTEADGTTYVRYLFDIPRVSVDEAFTSVMCVSATSPVPERAMEIITLFQTNKELANLLQYGIEGVNYQIDERDGSLHMMDDTYAMNNFVTGNTYIKYPEDNDPDYLKKCIKANLGSAPSALLGFNLELTGTEESQYETVKNILVAGKAAVDAGAKYDDVRKIVNRELILLGYDFVGTGVLSGIYGKVQAAQRALVGPISENFRLSDDIMNYNEHIGVVLEAPVVEEVVEEEVDGEATEGEAAEGAEGEVAEGEEAPAEEAAE